jgi:hypothetical protein
MNFKTLTAFLAFTLLSSNAFAGFLNAGGYVGSQNGNDKVNLLLKQHPDVKEVSLPS